VALRPSRGKRPIDETRYTLLIPGLDRCNCVEISTELMGHAQDGRR
jgi:hypothetical protein